MSLEESKPVPNTLREALPRDEDFQTTSSYLFSTSVWVPPHNDISPDDEESLRLLNRAILLASFDDWWKNNCKRN